MKENCPPQVFQLYGWFHVPCWIMSFCSWHPGLEYTCPSLAFMAGMGFLFKKPDDPLMGLDQ